MTKGNPPKTVSRGAVMQAVQALGIDPREVTMIYMNPQEVEVYYVKDVAEKKNKKYESFPVI